MLGFYEILPPKPYGRGTAVWRWRDIFGILQTKVSPSHGFAATAPVRLAGPKNATIFTKEPKMNNSPHFCKE